MYLSNALLYYTSLMSGCFRFSASRNLWPVCKKWCPIPVFSQSCHTCKE